MGEPKEPDFNVREELFDILKSAQKLLETVPIEERIEHARVAMKLWALQVQLRINPTLALLPADDWIRLWRILSTIGLVEVDELRGILERAGPLIITNTADEPNIRH